MGKLLSYEKEFERIRKQYDLKGQIKTVRDFERETRTCLDGEEQIKREEREKDLEMER